jgi:hypothetical protein
LPRATVEHRFAREHVPVLDKGHQGIAEFHRTSTRFATRLTAITTDVTVIVNAVSICEMGLSRSMLVGSEDEANRIRAPQTDRIGEPRAAVTSTGVEAFRVRGWPERSGERHHQ